MDAVYLGLIAALVALLLGLVEVCGRLALRS